MRVVVYHNNTEYLYDVKNYETETWNDVYVFLNKQADDYEIVNSYENLYFRDRILNNSDLISDILPDNSIIYYVFTTPMCVDEVYTTNKGYYTVNNDYIDSIPSATSICNALYSFYHNDEYKMERIFMGQTLLAYSSCILIAAIVHYTI